MKLTRLLIFVFVIFANEANAKLAVSSWQENSQLTKTGKISEIIIKAKVLDLPENMAMSAFSINFDPRQNIKIIKVISDEKFSDYEKNADFTFVNNSLSIKFPQAKKNGESISLYLYYNEYYQKINEFLRQETIYIPAFAVGAKATVTLTFPGYLESATFNPNVSKNSNSFIYNNIVGQSGVAETIKLTSIQDVWNISVKTKISSDQPLEKLVVKVPRFFQSAHQKVENYNVISSINPSQTNDEIEDKLLVFDKAENELLISSNAKITTGVNSRKIWNRNAADYIRNSDEEEKLLRPILEIIKNNKDDKTPLYVKIGQFVNQYLRYDINYIGKLPNLEEIIKNRVGVCTEYSRLFSSLSRLAGIPTITIEGAACGEYDECQGHSWNLIYFEGRWIEVDPTWNLMSGIVSSSHVYFNDYKKGDVRVEYMKKQNQNLKIKVDLEMQNLTRTSL